MKRTVEKLKVEQPNSEGIRLFNSSTFQLLFLALLLPLSLLRAQTWCSSGVSGSVTWACSQSYSANSATVPNHNDARIYSLTYLTSLGLSNTHPILVVVHGGIGVGVFNSNQPITTAEANLWAAQGWNVYQIAYTDGNAVVPTSAIHNGDTSISVAALISGAAWYWMTSASPNFGLTWDDGTGDIDTVTACSPCASTGSTMTVSGLGSSGGSMAHATTAHAFLTAVGGGNSIGWPVPENDLAAFLSFLATCSAGGTIGPGAGACTSYTKVPGNPNLISMWGSSTGAQMVLLAALHGCVTGTNCTYLNTTPSTPGYSEWSATGWKVQNPGGMNYTPVILSSPATDQPAVVAAEYQKNGDGFVDSVTNSAIVWCQANLVTLASLSGDTPFSETTLHNLTPTAAFNNCTFSSALSYLNGWYSETQLNFPVPGFIQSGATDSMFGPALASPGLGALLGAFTPLWNLTYSGQGHGQCYSSGVTCQAFIDATNVLGVNGCPTTQVVACAHSLSASGNLGMAGGVR